MRLSGQVGWSVRPGCAFAGGRCVLQRRCRVKAKAATGADVQPAALLECLASLSLLRPGSQSRRVGCAIRTSVRPASVLPAAFESCARDARPVTPSGRPSSLGVQGSCSPARRERLVPRGERSGRRAVLQCLAREVYAKPVAEPEVEAR